jgi:hypothetical protein
MSLTYKHTINPYPDYFNPITQKIQKYPIHILIYSINFNYSYNKYITNQIHKNLYTIKNSGYTLFIDGNYYKENILSYYITTRSFSKSIIEDFIINKHNLNFTNILQYMFSSYDNLYSLIYKYIYSGFVKNINISDIEKNPELFIKYYHEFFDKLILYGVNGILFNFINTDYTFQKSPIKSTCFLIYIILCYYTNPQRNGKPIFIKCLFSFIPKLLQLNFITKISSKQLYDFIKSIDDKNKHLHNIYLNIYNSNIENIQTQINNLLII